MDFAESFLTAAPTQSCVDGAGLRVTRANDADEHAQNLSRWDQRYDQLSAGSFEGQVTELWLPNTQVFVETANQQLRQTCAAWHSSVWFGIPAAVEGQMSMGGHALSEQAVCIRDGGAEFDLMTAPGFDLFGVVVDRAAFGEYLETTERRSLDQLLRQGDVLNLPLRIKRELCATLAGILGDAVARPADQLQQRIFAVLARLLTADGERDGSVNRIRLQRQETVNRVCDYLLQNPEEPPSIPDLCNRFHLSRRSLQNCFESATGMAPLAYMRSLRLNEVRRELKYGDQRRAISNVAYSWGFNHLSQFAQDYRRLFGESPSAARRS
ncbi:MAG TPA: helix-turn-helix domain-containing protein [Rhodocyclaceae bacterium]|nr:helix-turn-helix domain-containing protein [Rhodocyclaceae bacterium]